MPPIATKLPTAAPAANGTAPPKPAPRKRATTEEVAKEPQSPVVYPTVRAQICSGMEACTEAFAVAALYWETEAAYVSRKMVAEPGTDRKTHEYGEVYMLKDAGGNKVRCLNNLDNRPFDESWSNGLEQTILRGQWAGSLTLSDPVTATYGYPNSKVVEVGGKSYAPGDSITLTAGTVNGSTIVISRTGRVESGQHSLCALKRAGEKYRAAPKGTYPFWDAAIKAGRVPPWTDGQGNKVYGPVIETILITGVSEDQRVLASVDHCKPRSEADLFYTSELFVSLREKPGKRREMSRMLAACIDLFWKRADTKGYKTNTEVMGLVERHPRLIKAVDHLFDQNGDKRVVGDDLVASRLISNLRLSPGQCAALCYIMGCSASDGDAYRNGNPPREKGLDMKRWDAAKKFWASLGHEAGFLPLRTALERLAEGDPDSADQPGLGGKFTEKLALLAKAWHVYAVEGRSMFTDLDLQPGGCLHLTYSTPSTVDGKYYPAELQDDRADFGGIDVPERSVMTTPEGKPPTKEEVSARAEQARRDRIAAAEKETTDKIRNMRLDNSGRPVTTLEAK